MTNHIELISRQLHHLQKMRDYLIFSYERVKAILPITEWSNLNMEQHEILAAFRVRFSEFQEHLGKTMRAIAIEEEVSADRFGSVLSFMEKMKIIESAEQWKIIRELRNAVNHEYEEDFERLTQFFNEILKSTPELMNTYRRLVTFCVDSYGIDI